MKERRKALQAEIEQRFNSLYSAKFITPRESLLLRLTLDAVLAEVGRCLDSHVEYRHSDEENLDD